MAVLFLVLGSLVRSSERQPSEPDEQRFHLLTDDTVPLARDPQAMLRRSACVDCLICKLVRQPRLYALHPFAVQVLAGKVRTGCCRTGLRRR